jgi:hypothetical protein
MPAIDSNPTFNFPYKGKYNNKAALKSLNIGSDAFVTEQELNEMQIINSEQTSDLIRNITNSGVVTVNDGEDNENELYNKSKCFKPILEGIPNVIKFPPFQSVVNGNLISVKYFKDNKIQDMSIRLPNPPIAGTRNDFIFLQCWLKELKQNDKVHAFGYEDNDNLDYSILDERVGIETCRRMQLQWKIVIYEDYDELCDNGFLDGDGNPNPKIHPGALNGLVQGDFYFTQSDDKDLFIAGNGNKSQVPTADGYIYAIPLFTIRRINNSGYSQEMNIHGGIDYIDENSVSDRADGKFSNIIYNDQIIDLRHLAALGEEQYNKIYETLEDLYVYQTMLKNKLERVTQDLFHANCVLNNLGFSIPCTYDKDIYGINTYRQNGLTSGGHVVDVDDDSLVVYKKNKYYIGKQFEGKDYVVIPTLIDYDSYNKGELGDWFITYENKYFTLNNTGASGLRMNLTTLSANDQYIMSGVDSFNGTDGIEIETGIQLNTDIHFISIVPKEDTSGRNGDIYIKLKETSFIVYNTGLTTNDEGDAIPTTGNEFTWVLIDISNGSIQNIEMYSLNLNGPEGITQTSPAFGDNFSVMVSTPFLIPSGEIDEIGMIGETFVNTEEDNQFTLYSTGDVDIELYCNVMVFNEVPYCDYYDSVPVKKIIELDKECLL